MNTSFGIALLFMSLTLVIASPRGLPKYETKKLARDVELPEFFTAVTALLNVFNSAVRKADADFFALLGGNPQQGVVRSLISDTEKELTKEVEAAVDKALYLTPEEIPALMVATTNIGYALMSSNINRILAAVQNEGSDILGKSYDIVLDLDRDLVTGFQQFADVANK